MDAIVRDTKKVNHIRYSEESLETKQHRLNSYHTAMIEDTKIDQSNLAVESIKIPYIHGRWVKFFIDEGHLCKLEESRYAKIKKERSVYYMGNAPDSVYKAEPLHQRVLKTDLDTYLNADDAVIEAMLKLDVQRKIVDLLDSFLKQISQRSFNIKNAIDFLKFQNGG